MTQSIKFSGLDNFILSSYEEYEAPRRHLIDEDEYMQNLDDAQYA